MALDSLHDGLPDALPDSLHEPALARALHAVSGLSRRDFLRAASLAAATAAAPGLGFAAATKPPTLAHLDALEAAVYIRLAQVVLPVAGTPLATWTPEGLLGTLDAALLATMEPHILAGLRGGVRYFDEGPVKSYGKRFIALDDAAATRVCDEWGASAVPPQRALAMGLKKLVQLSYWANPATWAPLGYDGPVSKRMELPSLGNAPLPQA